MWSTAERFPAALRELAAGHRLAPHDVRLPTLAAEILVDMGELDRAAALARRTLAAHPQHLPACRALAFALERKADSVGGGQGGSQRGSGSRGGSSPRGGSSSSSSTAGSFTHDTPSTFAATQAADAAHFTCAEIAAHTLQQPEISAVMRLQAVFTLLAAGRSLGEAIHTNAAITTATRPAPARYWIGVADYLAQNAPVGLLTDDRVESRGRIMADLAKKPLGLQKYILTEWANMLVKSARTRYRLLRAAHVAQADTRAGTQGAARADGDVTGALDGLLYPLRPLECEDVPQGACAACLAEGCGFCAEDGSCKTPDKRSCNGQQLGPDVLRAVSVCGAAPAVARGRSDRKSTRGSGGDEL